MKSPNQKTSMKLLNTAIQCVQNAREDLKNDKMVRDRNIHDRLTIIETDLKQAVAALVALGYERNPK